MSSSTTEALLECLQSGDAASVIEAAREVAARGVAAAAPTLRQVLAATKDANVRNAVALALSDMRDPPSFEVLVDRLKSSETEGARGTLLYALRSYDCSPVLVLLVDFVIEGNFEVAHEALALITGIETELDEKTWHACAERLAAALDVTTDWRRPLLEQLVGLFR